MNNSISRLNFGQQIVPVQSDKPISPQEKADLTEMKKLLDQKIGKDVVSFQFKDPKSLDIVVNHPNPKIEEAIAERLKLIAASMHPQPGDAATGAKAAAQPSTTPKSLNAVG